jgi:hypothetical protein
MYPQYLPLRRFLARRFARRTGAGRVRCLARVDRTYRKPSAPGCPILLASFRWHRRRSGREFSASDSMNGGSRLRGIGSCSVAVRGANDLEHASAHRRPTLSRVGFDADLLRPGIVTTSTADGSGYRSVNAKQEWKKAPVGAAYQGFWSPSRASYRQPATVSARMIDFMMWEDRSRCRLAAGRVRQVAPAPARISKHERTRGSSSCSVVPMRPLRWQCRT